MCFSKTSFDTVQLRSDKPILCRVKESDGEIITDEYYVYADVNMKSWWEDMHPDGIGYYQRFCDYDDPELDDFYSDEGELLEILEPDKIELVEA